MQNEKFGGMKYANGELVTDADPNSQYSEIGQKNKKKLTDKIYKAYTVYKNELDAYNKSPPFAFTRAKNSVEYHKKQVEECPATRDRRIETMQKKYDEDLANYITKLNARREQELLHINNEYERVKTFMEEKLKEVEQTFEQQKQIKPKVLVKAELALKDLQKEWDGMLNFGPFPVKFNTENDTENIPITPLTKEELKKKIDEEYELNRIKTHKQIDEETEKLRQPIREEMHRLEREKREKEDAEKERARAISEANRKRQEEEDRKRQDEKRKLELENPDEFNKQMLQPVIVNTPSDEFESESDEDDDIKKMSNDELQKEIEQRKQEQRKREELRREQVRKESLIKRGDDVDSEELTDEQRAELRAKAIEEDKKQAEQPELPKAILHTTFSRVQLQNFTEKKEEQQMPQYKVISDTKKKPVKQIPSFYRSY